MTARPEPNLGDIFIAHRTQLRCIAQRIVRGGDLADEIMQEAYLKLAEGACARGVDKPFHYCCRVVRNLAIDHCRRRAVEAVYRVYTEDGELPQIAGGQTPDAALHERCMLDAVVKVLDTLPPRTRRAFELHRLTGLTQREIAQRLGCSATLVNFMLRDATNAFAACRELMERD
jgi:RNA polymerase sigma factor (sigma-70 family)